MQNIKTDQSNSDLQRSNASKHRKISLIRVFKREKVLAQLSRKINSQSEQQRNQSFRSKTQRPQTTLQSNQTKYLPNKFYINLPPHSKPKINIFNNEYVSCLKNGYNNVYQSNCKIMTQKQQKKSQVFEGPVYHSQYTKQQQHISNPQNIKQSIQQQVYKFDRNPKFRKYKITLKKQNLNNEQEDYQAPKDQKDKASLKKIMITQFKTQESKVSFPDIQSNNRLYSDDRSAKLIDPIPLSHNKNLLSLRSQNQSETRNVRNSVSFRIPKLRQTSDLYKSIKIFQRKQSLLGKIQSGKNIETKFGNRLFQNLLRNRHEQQIKKNDFIMKIEYDSHTDRPIEQFKNGFIQNLQNNKYKTNLRYNEVDLPSKLKGSKALLQMVSDKYSLPQQL